MFWGKCWLPFTGISLHFNLESYRIGEVGLISGHIKESLSPVRETKINIPREAEKRCMEREKAHNLI